MALPVPKGFLLAGVHCRIKSDPQKPDLALVMSEVPAVGAGVYTRNLVCAAPVQLDRQRTPSDRIRTVVVNAGNANACTGQRGLADARKMAEMAAAVGGQERSRWRSLQLRHGHPDAGNGSPGDRLLVPYELEQLQPLAGVRRAASAEAGT